MSIIVSGVVTLFAAMQADAIFEAGELDGHAVGERAPLAVDELRESDLAPED